MRRGMILACWSLLGLCLAVCAEDGKRDELCIPVPADMDIAPSSLSQLRTGCMAEKAAFLRFLVDSNMLRFDAADGTWERSVSKGIARKKAFSEFIKKCESSWRSEQSILALNPVLLRAEVAPRLSGHVLRVGPGEEFSTLESAAKRLQAGDVLCLGPGRFKLPERIALQDIVLHGAGQKLTTLHGARGTTCRRVRFEKMKIDCDNEPFIDCRDGGSADISSCYVCNYNSGAGSSEAIFGVNIMLLVSDSTFEGLSGKDATNFQRTTGWAFDLRDMSALYAVHTAFIDNSEIMRPGYICVLDECSTAIQNSDAQKRPWGHNMLYPEAGASVFLRNTTVPMRNPELTTFFKESTDDINVIMGLADPEHALAADSFFKPYARSLSRNVLFWISLLRHQDPDIRKLAGDRIEALTGEKVKQVELGKAEERKLASAAETERQLDDEDFAVRERAEAALCAAPDAAWRVVKRLLKDSSPHLRTEAQQLSRKLPAWITIDTDSTLACEQEFARMTHWLAENTDKLQWSDAGKRYMRAH